MDAKLIVNRLGRLISDRKTVDEQWEQIRRFVTPYRGQFFKESSTEHSVEWKENRYIFDSTAVNAANTLASSLHGSLTSPAIRWFDISYRSQDLNKDWEAGKWLEEATKRVYDALRDSNFDLEANEAYLDLVSYGTAIIVEEVIEDAYGGFDHLVFQSVPIKECFFEQDHEGQVVRLYRKMKWSPLMVKEKFGDQTPETIVNRAERGDSNMDIDIVFAVYERDQYKNADRSKILAPKLRPFGYKYVLIADASQIGDEGGYYEMPAFVPRWRKTAESIWGNSPAMAALPDIMTLNKLVQLILVSLEKVVDPAIVTTERGLLSDLDLSPGGINVVRRMDELGTFESRARFDVAELHREKLQSSIRQAFYVDQLELKESPAMTATEVNVRYELMQRLLGPTLGRLKSDYLDPLIRLTFANLYRYGRFSEVPKILEDFDATLDIMYVGPLSRVQRVEQAQSVERLLAATLPLVQVAPQIADMFDFDEVVRVLHDYYQAPTTMLAPETKVRKKRADREQKQDMMERAQIMEQIGKGAEASAKGGQALGAG